jgi:protocatechuate 3,4-dioxygenase alpha subunit
MKFIPTASQTVGPFFSIGLAPLYQNVSTPPASEEKITIRGSVYDADHSPIPDAVLEFWGPNEFARVPTAEDGTFAVSVEKAFARNTNRQHFDVLIFMRGLLKPAYTRVYFGTPDAIANDSILKLVAQARIATLFAASNGTPNQFVWNIVMQGENETVFFEF